MVENVLACLDSYYCHGNAHDVLVSTTHPQVFELVSLYRACSGRRFELLKVTDDDVVATFGVRRELLHDERCYRIIFSKFYPILRRLDARIVHLDYDTLFLSRVDFEPLFASGIGLVDSNRVCRRPKFRPNKAHAAFFRVPRTLRPVASWINTGVFSVQGSGFELCRSEVHHYLRNFDYVRAAGIDVNADESIMNSLAFRERRRVSIVRDFTFNFLAYCVKYVPDWLTRGGILHFHSIKPHAFWYDGERVAFFQPGNGPRIGEPFYRAVLLWCSHFHAATRGLDVEFGMQRVMPLEVVEYERARLEGRLPATSSDQELEAGSGSAIVQGPVFEYEHCEPFEDLPEPWQPGRHNVCGRRRGLVHARRSWAS
jgi:hypothetical protein